VIVLRQIVHGGSPILYVCHDIEDHGWQFLGWDDFDEEDAMVVSLASMLERDPSIREVADLPPGWHAFRRTPEEPWTREPNP
jgi:hypothetical protein